jgi:hypothetical protein
MEKSFFFFYTINMASTHKAGPTSEANLVKAVKAELEKCPKARISASETPTFQRPQVICCRNSPHMVL